MLCGCGHTNTFQTNRCERCHTRLGSECPHCTDWIQPDSVACNCRRAVADELETPSFASHRTPRADWSEVRRLWSEVRQFWSEIVQMWSNFDRVSDKVALVLLLLMVAAQAVLGVVLFVLPIYTSLQGYNSPGPSHPLR